MQLNDPQQSAVRHTETPLLVVAGAGSGKTRVITEKLVYLIREHDMAANRIAAVTFTNKAAKEMRERAGSRLERKEGRGLRISTFHTLGLSILKAELQRAGLRESFSIYDGEDSRDLIIKLGGKRGTDANAQARDDQLILSSWKNLALEPKQAIANAQDDDDLRRASLYAKYQDALRASNAVDFDDLIGLPLTVFKEYPEALAGWRERIRYLMVDEYQDTNGAQYELVRALVGDRGKLTAVGDDDQSVYSWRGAQPENLMRLQTDFANLRIIKLEQNYRSSNRILSAANRLISNNPRPIPKSLWSAQGNGPPISVIRTQDERDEARRVAGEIVSRSLGNDTKYGQFAILYRGNFQSRPFEQALRELSIPYRVSGAISFFDRSEVKDVVAYLRLVANPDDDAAFLRIVNTPRREIGPSTLQALGAYAAERDRPLLACADDLAIAERCKPRAVEALGRFTHWVESLAKRAEQLPADQLCGEMLDESGYLDWLSQQEKNEAALNRRLENIADLRKWLVDRAKNKPLTEALSALALAGILERDNDDAAENQVSLMTMHASKGLEFDQVFIAGFEEDLLPHVQNSEDETLLSEERRLAYVGLTRAQRRLTLTYAASRKQHGTRRDSTPSRFLEELANDEIEWIGGGPSGEVTTTEETGTAALAGLRAMLSND